MSRLSIIMRVFNNTLNMLNLHKEPIVRKMTKNGGSLFTNHQAFFNILYDVQKTVDNTTNEEDKRDLSRMKENNLIFSFQGPSNIFNSTLFGVVISKIIIHVSGSKDVTVEPRRGEFLKTKDALLYTSKTNVQSVEDINPNEVDIVVIDKKEGSISYPEGSSKLKLTTELLRHLRKNPHILQHETNILPRTSTSLSYSQTFLTYLKELFCYNNGPDGVRNGLLYSRNIPSNANFMSHIIDELSNLDSDERKEAIEFLETLPGDLWDSLLINFGLRSGETPELIASARKYLEIEQTEDCEHIVPGRNFSSNYKIVPKESVIHATNLGHSTAVIFTGPKNNAMALVCDNDYEMLHNLWQETLATRITIVRPEITIHDSNSLNESLNKITAAINKLVEEAWDQNVRIEYESYPWDPNIFLSQFNIKSHQSEIYYLEPEGQESFHILSPNVVEIKSKLTQIQDSREKHDDQNKGSFR